MTDTAAVTLVKEKVWPSFGYEPHRGQQLIHEAPERHRVASCGRRFGKSMAGGRELALEALYTSAVAEAWHDRGQRREFWIVGPEYSDSEKEFRVAYNSLKGLDVPFDHPGTYNNPENGDLHISLWQGAYELHAKSAKYPSTLVGEGLSGVVLAEAAKLKEKVWAKYIRPTLADFLGWSLSLSTPEGKNWFYELWKRGQDPADTQWASWRMPSWINDRVFPLGSEDPEIFDMAGDMSIERFRQEIGAEFTEFVGRVFKAFDEEVHVGDFPYDRRYPVYACCDYGWTNPFVWLFIQIDAHGTVYVLDEIRRVETDINDCAEIVASHPLSSVVRTFYPDPAEPGDTAVLEKKLKIRANPDTGGELKWRLEYIRRYLKLIPEHVPWEEREPMLNFDRKCVDLIREMQDYRWPDTKVEAARANPRNEPEKPLDYDDHGPEALGRFFRGHFGSPEKSRPTRQKKAKLS